MILSQSEMRTRMNKILDSEVLDRVGTAIKENSTKHPTGKVEQEVFMPYLKGEKRILDSAVFDGNIEKFYGIAQVPVGLIGPLRVNGAYANDSYSVPLATTEGALVASYNRGARVISLSGGANVLCLSECMTRSPGFIFDDILESSRFVAWCSGHLNILKDIVRSTTRHGHLEDFQSIIDGKYVWLVFKFVTGDASGQNMVTIASDAVCRYIVSFSPFKPKKWYIDANVSGDKKATRFSFQSGRGKNMVAEVTIKSAIVKKFLHTTPEEIVEYSQMAMLGAIHSGSIGVNGHFANALAALFIACGQDAACVAESSTGTSKAQLTDKGDLYVSIALPNLVVGTVGGGTHLPTQRECLEMMGCYGKDYSHKFAEICTAVVLAGEISIAAAIAGGHFTQAHIKYGRKAGLKKESQHEWSAVNR